jgi:hypothetical protein
VSVRTHHIKAADVAEIVEVAKIVEIATQTDAQSTGLELDRPGIARKPRSAHYLREPGNGTARASFARNQDRWAGHAADRSRLSGCRQLDGSAIGGGPSIRLKISEASRSSTL